MAKKNSSGCIILLIVSCAIIWIIAAHNLTIFIIGGLAIAAWLANRFFFAKKRKSAAPKASSREPLSFQITFTTSSGYHDFKATSINGDEFWVPINHSVKISNFDIGGLVYFGKGLAAVREGGPEPALIDPGLRVAKNIEDYSIRRLSYWPSYSGASPEGRAAYLRWLSFGRKDPTADIGYVFLYFYGLERRALHDAKMSIKAREELPIIENEIERLLTIYAQQSGSFENYAGSLLDFLRARDLKEKLYEKPPPPLRMGRFFTFEHRLGLAQCSADNRPLPHAWAFMWLMGDQTTRLRTPARRCPEEFQKLFAQCYHEAFDDGMKLPQSQTRLRLEHRAASATFGLSRGDLAVHFDLPDVSILSGPVKKLQELAEDCCTKLEAYSRVVGKDKTHLGTSDAIIELPLALWPDQHRRQIEELRNIVVNTGKPLVVNFEKLNSLFPKKQIPTRQKMQSLYRVLKEAGLGMEPDIRFGGAVPEPNSKVVFFADNEKITPSLARPQYLAAALTSQLAAVVAIADGEVSEVEKVLLLRQMEKLLYLNESERNRLQARLQLLFEEPPKLIGLKKRIEAIGSTSREAIGDFLAMVAQADADVTLAEIKILEKIFKLLELDPKTVYSRMHIAATEPVIVRAITRGAEGYVIPKPSPPKELPLRFKLDAARIAALQVDSERVAAVLGSIFNMEPFKPEVVTSDQDSEHTEETQKLLIMGLDKEHSLLLRVLMSRSQWSRSELKELASDRSLMLDGALERINEASYNLFNKPFFEGDDPIELNQEVVREVLK